MDMPVMPKITEAEIAELFCKLPLSLRKKILPQRNLTPRQKVEERIRFTKLTSSIVPAKYRNADAARNSAAEHYSRAPGVEAPPVTNRGGKWDERTVLPSVKAKEVFQIVALGKQGKYIKVCIPKPDKGYSVKHSFVDWVNYTFKSTLNPRVLAEGHHCVSEHDYIQSYSLELFKIFGFGVTREREKGMNFYKHSYDLGDNGLGLICIGGQKESVSVTIKGQGLMAAKEGWEKRLYDHLSGLEGAKITRIDLANDNFNSKTNLDEYLGMYKAGLFTSNGRPPNVEQAGNWINPTGKGRTLYIGNRTSGKLLRIYEKGLQLANGFHEKYPNWVRVELELKSDDRVIPLDALMRPGQYLAGAYPALANMHKVQERVKTFKHVVLSTLERTVETTRHQFGKHIWTITEYYGVEKALEMLTKGKEELPKSLDKIRHFNADFEQSEFLHSTKPLYFNQGEQHGKNASYGL